MSNLSLKKIQEAILKNRNKAIVVGAGLIGAAALRGLVMGSRTGENQILIQK